MLDFQLLSLCIVIDMMPLLFVLLYSSVTLLLLQQFGCRTLLKLRLVNELALTIF